MRPVFDDKDREILYQREAEWNKIPGPRVGDFVRMLDGSLRRFTHDWGDGLQTTCGESHPGRYDQRFYFGGGHVSFSGSLDPAILKSQLRVTGETMHGGFWFFHHGWVTAHNGVDFTVSCKVYEQIAP